MNLEEDPILITPDMLAGETVRSGPGGGSARIDFERGMRMAPPLILVLILANQIGDLQILREALVLARSTLVNSPSADDTKSELR